MHAWCFTVLLKYMHVLLHYSKLLCMSDHLADAIEQMNTRWMPLVAEGLWLCSQADSQVALRRRVASISTAQECTSETNKTTNTLICFLCDSCNLSDAEKAIKVQIIKLHLNRGEDS